MSTQRQPLQCAQCVVLVRHGGVVALNVFAAVRRICERKIVLSSGTRSSVCASSTKVGLSAGLIGQMQLDPWRVSRPVWSGRTCPALAVLRAVHVRTQLGEMLAATEKEQLDAGAAG